MTNQTVTGSRLTGYIVSVTRSPVIERLMVRDSQVALKHVFHDIEIRTLVMELRQRAIKRWVPCGDMGRKLKIPYSAKVECGFRTTTEECLYDLSLSKTFKRIVTVTTISDSKFYQAFKHCPRVFKNIYREIVYCTAIERIKKRK